jgi:hypothetical protein
MKSVYRVLAYVIAAEVVVQAAAIAFAVFGLSKWVEDGGTLTKAAMESEDTKFTGVLGFAIHGMNGTMLIPLVTLVFLVVSFFAKVPGGLKWAGFVVLAVVVQVLLGMFAHGAPALGLLHGANALVLFGLAVTAGRRVGRTVAETSPLENADVA